MEIWKDIPNYPKYQISNLGRVRSLKGEQPLILKTYKYTNGYVNAALWKNKRTHKMLLHRLVAKAFIPNPNGYNEVNHKDEDKTNNRADNLEWCDHRYNLNYGSVKEKISCSHKGKKLSNEHIEKLRIDSSNKRWINNGTIESFTKLEKIPELLKNGWFKGRLKHKPTVSVY